MKLKKIVAGILAAVLVITAIPLNSFVFAADETKNVGMTDSGVLLSPQMKITDAGMAGCKDQQYTRADLPTIATLQRDVIEQFNNKGNEWNWVAYKVHAPQDGEYELGIKVNNCKWSSYSLPMWVNDEAYTLTYTAKNQKQTVNVTLPAGDHTIVAFTPMPVDESSRQGNVYNDYPWCDLESFVIDVDLTNPEKVVNSIDVTNAFYTRVESGNETYVTYDHMAEGGYKATSNKSHAEGVKTSKVTQTLTTLVGDNQSLNYLDKSGLPYVQYLVEASETGEYYINAGFQSNLNGANKTEKSETLFTVIANDKVYEVEWSKKAQGWYNTTIKVELQKGMNVIRTTGIPKSSYWFGGWINMDYLAIETGAQFITADTKTIAAGDETQVLANKFTDKGNALEGAVTSGIRGDKPSIETLSRAGQEIANWPWAAMKVSAPKDGYYDITVNLGTNGSASSTQIAMLVDGEPISKAYTKGGSASVDGSVYLTKGTHVIVFTSPMPKTKAEAEATTSSTVAAAYPWVNYNSFVLDGNLTVAGLPTVEESILDLQSVVKASNEDRVLFDYFTNDGSKLKDRDYTNMQYDHATIETLPYSGNKIQSWPYAAIQVDAKAEGDYEIAIGVASKSAKKFGLIVDGTVYSLDYTNAGKVQEISTKVHLTQGNHVLTFTAAIPENVSGVDTSKNLWDIYTWTDINYIVLDKGIALSEKPQVDQIGSQLGNTFDAVDTTTVIYGNYKNHNVDNSGMIANPNANYLKENRISLETLLNAGWDRAPYTALEVTVDKAGNYDIYATVLVNSATTSEQLGMVIDGKEVKTVKVKKTASKQLVGDSIYLEKGTHLIAFTSPMPLNDEAAQAITDPNTDSYTDMNKAYPWFNVYEFYFGKGVTVSDNVGADATTVNVMDTAKVSKNWSTYKDSNDEDELADYLGANTDDYKYDRVSVETVLESELGRLPYVSVTVEAEADGYYDIFAKVMTKSSITSKCAAMIVDGTTVYPISIAGTGSKQDIGAFIPLTKGTHTIAITSAMPKTDAEAQGITDPNEDGWVAMNNAYPWFDFYSVTVSGRLSIVSGAENPLIDKSVLFAGDSITFSSKSWASKIGTWNHMDWKNAAIGGATVSTIKTRHIIHQLKANAANDYDYVIMNGGINDAMSEIEIGTVSESWNVADFDNTTYIGALETMFYYAYENFDGARIGYIITYATPNSNLGGYTQDMKAYYAEAKRACVKWNIPYIDLYEGTVVVDGKELSYSYDILQVDKNADIFINNDEHEIHINDEGYKIITPYIEAWMMTLDENANPLKEENRFKYIDAGDEAKVLSNGFTVSEGTLIDRVYTGMSEDEANIEMLPYAKELLDDWAFASVKVNAEKAGDYKIMVEYSAKNATQMGMLVDGEVYTLDYTKKDGYCQFVEQTVSLTAGTHYITFTAAMPEEMVDVVGDAWNLYPWTNIISIVVDADLEVMSKPNLSEVTSQLGTTTDMGQTVVNAGDETKVLQNYFKDNGDTLGNMSASDLRYDKLTLDKVSVDHTHYMPYIALKVSAEQEGYYDILLDVEANKTSVSDQIGLIIDGKDVQVVEFEIASKTKIKATVYLEKGAHTLTFTSPMPETVEEFETYAKEHELTIGNGATHPWINFNKITLGKGLTVENVPTVAEVEYPEYNRIEAENNKYVIYNGYTPDGETASKASDGKVAGGVNRWHIEQSFEDLKTWIDASDSHVAYVEYAVEAPADGEYIIRPGFLADVNKNVKNRNDIAKPFVVVLVNNDIYKAQYTADWGETQAVAVKVSLKKGQNIIRVTTYTADQEIRTVSSWINQDFLDLDKRLTALERSSTVVEAENSKFYSLLTSQDGGKNEKASNGKVLGNAKNIRAKSIGLTIENFTTDQIWMAPYFSYTVVVPMDGYYSISVNFTGDGRMPISQIGVIVDDEISSVKYNRCGAASSKNKAVTTIYLTKGEHNITFTTPLPLNDKELASANWSYYWMNFDYVTFHDGLKLAAKQKSPTTIADLVRVEAEDVGLPNMTKVCEAAEGKDATEGYIGSAKYRRAQTVAEMKAEGIDETSTAFVQYTVNAKTAGTYTVYFQALYGIYNPPTDDLVMDATVAIEVNGEVSFHTVQCKKASTQSMIPVTMKLSAGNNVVRVTHFTSDSVNPKGGYCWVDFNYIEMAAVDSEKITFVPTTGVVEAERSEVVSYITNSSSGSSGGECLGNADYKYIDEKDVTFENLDVNNLGDLSRVTYTVMAEKAGTYNVAIQFNGGVTKYTFNELVEKGAIGFAVSVNAGEKQLVEFCPDAGTGSYSRIVEVDLKEGENKIMVTATLADYISGVNPYIEDEYRIYWMDHDALRLTAGVNATDMEVEPYDVNDTDIDHAQLDAKEPTAVNSNGDGEGINMVAVGIIAASTLALVGLFIFIILLKKRKKEDEENTKTNLSS